MPKLHLVDGTYELFRAFYSPGSGHRRPDGAEVGATRRLLRSMVSLLSEPDVTHVGIAFDTVIESFRNELFDGYKTGEGIDPELWNQFSLVEEASEALGLTVWRMIDFEADDGLATAAARFVDEVEQVVICSPDKDLCQCVTGHRVISRDRRQKKELDEAGVTEKFGIPPQSIPDWLALVGDTADGIPGLPRWGAKTAATVLAHYHRLEAIPLDAGDWDIKVRGAKTLAENLAAEHQEAKLYKVLATLRTDVPLAEKTLDELRWTGPQPGFDDLLRELDIASLPLPEPR